MIGHSPKSPKRLAWAAGITLALVGTGLVAWLAAYSSGPVRTIRLPTPLALSNPTAIPIPPPASSPFHFSDVTRESGIDFAYRNGEEAGLRTILESLGGGVAILDFDGDGRPDLFFTGGGWFEKSSAGIVIKGLPNRLYRNLGGWRFRDVTAETGLDGTTGYGHGAAVGDFDNDGDPDLLVTSYQGTSLYRNEAGRRFVDVTIKAGLMQPGWATSAAWADFDRDGRLDLYVTRYVNWSPRNNPPCRYRYSGEIDICALSVFEGLTDALYLNEGGGTFREVSRFDRPPGRRQGARRRGLRFGRRP